MNVPGPVSFPGLILRYASPNSGPTAPPGKYQVRLTAGGASEVQPLEIQRDPRVPNVTDDDLRRQFQLAIQIRDAISQANQTYLNARNLSLEIERRNIPEAAAIVAKLTDVAEALYQTRNRSARDTLNYPIKLNNQLAVLEERVNTGDYPPTDQDYAVFAELQTNLKALVNTYSGIIAVDLKHLNDTLTTRGLPPISAP
jgi:hypothetical protein